MLHFLVPQSSPRRQEGLTVRLSDAGGGGTAGSWRLSSPASTVSAPKRIAQPENLPVPTDSVASPGFLGTWGLKLHVRLAAVGAGGQNYPHHLNYFSRDVFCPFKVTECPPAAQCVPRPSERRQRGSKQEADPPPRASPCCRKPLRGTVFTFAAVFAEDVPLEHTDKILMIGSNFICY